MNFDTRQLSCGCKGNIHRNKEVISTPASHRASIDEHWERTSGFNLRAVQCYSRFLMTTMKCQHASLQPRHTFASGTGVVRSCCFYKSEPRIKLPCHAHSLTEAPYYLCWLFVPSRIIGACSCFQSFILFQ